MQRLFNRRSFLRRALASAGGAAALPSMGHSTQAAIQPRQPIVTCIDWQLSVHPAMYAIADEQGVRIEEYSPIGFVFDRFIVEKNQGFSTWDAYSGATPLLEMKPLADTGTIEPWDPYLPEDALTDFLPATRDEGTYNGGFYVWPLLLDVIVQGWHAGIVERAGLDPEDPPPTWDDFIANARQVQRSGAAQYGCVFDHRDWRSLIPITHSFDTDVYSPDGLFLYTSDAAVHALEVMKRLMELSSPDILSDSIANSASLVDQAIWSSEQAGYYFKMQNAPLGLSDTWSDPGQVRLARLPFQPGTAGGTVFWDTGCVLLTYGSNKREMAEFLWEVSVDERIWRNSLVGDPEQGTSRIGQLPPLQSIWQRWRSDPPDFLESARWVFSVLESMDSARAIQPTALAMSQFDVARPEWQAYLSGEASSPRMALTRAYDAVRAEFRRQTGVSPA